MSDALPPCYCNWAHIVTCPRHHTLVPGEDLRDDLSVPSRMEANRKLAAAIMRVHDTNTPHACEPDEYGICTTCGTQWHHPFATTPCATLPSLTFPPLPPSKPSGRLIALRFITGAAAGVALVHLIVRLGIL